MQLPDRAALLRALHVRRNQVLLALFVLLVAVRIALPYVLRPIIVEQTDKALVGRIALRDLDLSLIRGGVTLHGLEVYPDELPPPGAPVAAKPKPPLFAAERLWTQISWLALLWKTIEVEEFELDDFTVRLDRLKDGLVLPKPVPSAEPAPAEPAPAAASPWGFAADGIALTNGAIVFRDFTVGQTPQRLDLAIPNLVARQLALRFDPSGHEPGHVAVEAEVGGGKIGFEADLEQKAAGPATHSKIRLANLPIGGVRVYLKMFGWSDLEGTLDAEIDHRFETGGAHRVGGNVSLSNVVVRVPKLDRPALTFQKLAVALDEIDVVKQDAALADVTLTGARVVVDPRAKIALPLLAPPAAAAAAAEPVEEPKVAAEPGPPPRPWTWSVKRTRLSHAEVDLLGAADSLVLGVDADVRKLASPTTGASPVSLSVHEGEGSLGLDGKLTLEPLGWNGKLAIHELALAPLAARAPVPGAELLRGGRARADLEIILAGKGSSAPGAADLRVAGTFGLAGLEVGKAGDKDFSLAWKDLALQLREATVVPALGGDPAKPRAVAVTLDRVQLVEPAISLARTAQGLALPAIGGGAEPDAAKSAAAPAEPAPAPVVKARLDKLRVERGRVRFSDRSVTPFYDGRVEQLDVIAGNLRWPPPAADPFVVDLKGLHGAVLHVHGGIGSANSRVRAELTSLPLAPFNPYVTPSGFSLANGSLELAAKALFRNDAYDGSTDLKLVELEVGGAEGEALFEQNFGIPLSMALGLLKDQSGAITLSVPIAGDRQGARVGLASLAGQALRKALVGALASPLKLLGVTTRNGKVQSLRPEPVEFLAGSSEPTKAGDERIEQLGVLLSASPGISLGLHGGTSAVDERALRERALLAELERTSGFRALGNLGEIGTRRAVRLWLEARAKGETPEPLDAERSAWLETNVAAQAIENGALDALAAKRAAVLADRLVAGHGVDASRVVVGAPATAGSMAVPGVSLDVGARKTESR
jgi:Domain of Unknown Function (DUF748)